MYISKVLIGIVVHMQENTKKQRRWIYWQNIRFAELHTNDHDIHLIRCSIYWLISL